MLNWLLPTPRKPNSNRLAKKEAEFFGMAGEA